MLKYIKLTLATFFSSIVSLNLIYSNDAKANSLSLSLSGNLGISSSFLSEGSFIGSGILPDFDTTELFNSEGVSFISGNMEFFDSSGQLIPSETTNGIIRGIDINSGTAEIIAQGIQKVDIEAELDCIAIGGIFLNDFCEIFFEHIDIVMIPPELLGELEWLSGAIILQSEDGTETVTSVTSATFNLQTVPEPSTIIGLGSLTTFAIGRSIKDKLAKAKKK